MTAPLLQQSTPLDDATGVATTANLRLIFNQAVKVGSGFIRIYKSDGTLFHSIAATDTSQVTFDATQPARVTINPSIDLISGTGYYVLIDAGAIENAAGEDFAGISSSTQLNFTTAGSPPGGGDTTAPLLTGTSPLDNATGVAVGANLALTFNESVKAGTGNIEIHNVSDGSIAKSIAVTDATQITFSGNQLTINPTTDLAAGTGYYITLASGVVRDLANNNYAGISSATAFNFTTASGADTTAPLLTGTSPLDNATGVAAGANLILTFDEAVKAGTGSIEIHNVSDGSIAKSIAVTDATQITFSGNQLTINPTTDLAAGTGYYVTLASGVVRDLANNNFAGISSATAFNFTTASGADTTAPLLTGTSPLDNATGVAVGANLILTFNEAVKAGVGNIEIRNTSNGTIAKTIAVTDATQITFSGNQLTINPTTDLAVGTGYYVTLASGVVRDLANNNFAGISSATAFNFTTASGADTTAPLLTGTSPLDNATGVAAGANLILTFDEAVKAGTGNIEIRNTSNGTIAKTIAVTDATQITFSGNQLTINPTTDLASNGRYYVTLASGVVRDLANNNYAGISSPTAFNFTTAAAGGGDTTAPLLTTTSPLDDATGVAAGTNLVLTFNESVKAGTGNIEIHNASDGTIAKSIAVTDATQITFSGNQLTINPTTDLAGGAGYYVTLASGVVRDIANNNFAGISSATAFNFTTFSPDAVAPQLVSTLPVDNAALAHPASNIVLTFDEAVKAGSGNIEIRLASNDSIAKSIAITDASQVTFSGSQVTINPATNLAVETAYYVTIASGVILDLANNAFAGISSPTAFNFTTKETTPPVLVSTTPTDGGLNVDVDADLVLTFNEAVKAGSSGYITLHYNGGWIAHTIAVTDASQVSFSGNQLIINPNIDLLEDTFYYVSIEPGVVRDLVNNVYLGTPWAFDFHTADPNPPLLVSTSPVDDASLVWSGADLILWFNEAVVAGSGNIEIRNVADGSIARTIAVTDTNQVSFDSYSMTIDPSTDLAYGGSYYVTFGSGVVLDLVGNAFGGILSPTTFNFTIEPSDLTGPLMTGSSPIDNATDAGIGSDLIVTFNEAVKAGTGYIYISYSANGTYARVIDVNETSQISFSGNQLIIDPTSDLTEGVGYNVSWNASAVTDLAGNAFGGGYPSSFHFVTADPTPPQLVSTLPVDDATGVYVDTNLRLGFNEVVKAGSGTIEIRYASDGSIAKSIPITDTSQVTFDGYQIIINPNTNLQQATSYYVTLASGVVLDLAGNPFGGVSSPNVFNFSTPINVLLGTLNPDTMSGGANNDSINGLAGLDNLLGGTGDDTYIIKNYERGTTQLLLSWDPNPGPIIIDPDGEILSFAPDAEVYIELVDNNADGLVDELHADFEDEAWDGGVVFTTTQLGVPLQSGTYLNTERYGNTSPGHPGFVLRIESTIPGQSYGSFTVVALEIDYSGAAPVLVRASITFDMDPLGYDMHLHGVFNYNYAPAGQSTHDAVIEQPNAGIDSVEAWVSYALPANVENLKLVGYGNTDGWGNELDNVISGNGYSNILDGAGGNDTLAGSNSGDTFNVVSGEGSDTIVDFGAGAGVGDIANLDGFALTTFGAVQAALSQDGDNTVLNLGNGQTLTFLNVAPAAFSADDFSFLHLPPPLFVAAPPVPPGPQPFTLPVSGNYTNTISGGFGADNLTGTSANNRLDGSFGNDTMAGLGGDDTYLVDASGDVVVESASSGIDTVVSSASSYALASNVENLRLTGSITHSATGNSLNNLIIASNRPDTIDGGAGTDILQAGTGACVLTGGAGNDMFAFPVIGSQKTITDFHVGEDLVDLRTLLASYGGSDPIGDGLIALTAVAGGVRISVDPTLSGTKQNLVTLTGVAVGDVHVGTDILY